MLERFFATNEGDKPKVPISWHEAVRKLPGIYIKEDDWYETHWSRYSANGLEVAIYMGSGLGEANIARPAGLYVVTNITKATYRDPLLGKYVGETIGVHMASFLEALHEKNYIIGYWHDDEEGDPNFLNYNNSDLNFRYWLERTKLIHAKTQGIIFEVVPFPISFAHDIFSGSGPSY